LSEWTEEQMKMMEFSAEASAGMINAFKVALEKADNGLINEHAALLVTNILASINSSILFTLGQGLSDKGLLNEFYKDMLEVIVDKTRFALSQHTIE